MLCSLYRSRSLSYRIENDSEEILKQKVSVTKPFENWKMDHVCLTYAFALVVRLIWFALLSLSLFVPYSSPPPPVSGLQRISVLSLKSLTAFKGVFVCVCLRVRSCILNAFESSMRLPTLVLFHFTVSPASIVVAYWKENGNVFNNRHTTTPISMVFRHPPPPSSQQLNSIMPTLSVEGYLRKCFVYICLFLYVYIWLCVQRIVLSYGFFYNAATLWILYAPILLQQIKL